MKSRLFDCAVLVLGMHRSGTSALAGVLARCGLGLPEHMIASSDANERGFFESEPVNALNNAVLADFGQTWLSLGPLDDAIWRSKDMAGRRRDLAKLLGTEFSSTRAPVIKDPRICRLLPLWKGVLEEQAEQSRAAFILRPPNEVAGSLNKRNELEFEFGLLLWARYNLDAEHQSRGLRRCFVSFNGLLADWRATVDKLDLPIDPAAIDSEAIEQFLSGSLRHHNDEVPEFRGVPIVADLFEILSRWAVEGERTEDYPLLDSLREKLDEMGPVLGELSEKGRLERKRRTSLAAKSAAAAAELASRESQFADFAGAIEQALTEIDKKSEALGEQVQRLGDDLSRSMRLVEEKDQAVRALADENRQLEEENRRLEVEAARASALAEERSKALGVAQEAWDRAEKGLLKAAKLVDDQSNKLIVAKEHRRSLEKKLAEFEAVDAELRNNIKSQLAELEAAEVELKSVKRKYRSTQTILEREQNRAARLERRIEQAQETIARLESGLAYRFAKAVASFRQTIANMLSFRGEASSKRQAELRLIRESDLFDANWYLKTYPDVAAARLDAARHFADMGWREGRNPSAAFCTTRYLRRYPDVAQLGVNPLVHFLEHGNFEGREAHGVGELPTRTGGERRGPRPALPPAMPVFSGQQNEREPLVWLRACNLAGREAAIMVDDLGLGIVSSEQVRSQFEAVIADFEALCGASGKLGLDPPVMGELPRLQDGWFATSHHLVTRWTVDRPTVIRALQVDPLSGQLTLVGEALASDVLASVEFDLASPTMPLLFISATVDGELLAAGRMAFPSLFRGGFHYPELIASPHEGPSIDAMAASEEMEQQLRQLRAGASQPAVRIIETDLAGADGAGPLFQRDLRDLLGRVLMIGISPSTESDGEAVECYLQERVKLAARHSCRRGGGKLILASDMVPALGVLVSPSTAAQRSKRTLAMSLVVSDIDPSQPAVRFDPPTAKSALPLAPNPSYPLTFPQLRGALAEPRLAAIRQLSRPLDDAEYLMPDLSVVVGEGAKPEPIDWLIDPAGWDEALLGQSLMALGAQSQVGTQRLLFTQSPSPLVMQVARSTFGSEPAIFDGLDMALAGCEAPLIGHLGEGVVLHDARTVAFLSWFLQDSGVSSASCALVASAKRGKSWKTQLVDAGSFEIDRRVVFGPRASHPAEMIWRATYAVVEPPRFWVARPEDIRRWRTGEGTGKEVHLVTSLITASLEGNAESELGEPPVMVVSAPAGRSVSAKVLVG